MMVDLRKLCPYIGGAIDQFTPPLNFELAGTKFEFVMDDGYDYILDFLDKDTLEWHWAGDAPKRAKYWCEKGDDTTYLVSFEHAGAAPRANHTFVIDRENNLVTRIIAKLGTNPKDEYLITPEYEFGVIRAEGQDIKPYPRHGFTGDLRGTVVQWAYGSEMATVHVYYCSNFYRITYPRDPAFSEEAKKMNEMFNNILKDLPSSDEPTRYIKIKDGLYLFSLTESNGERILGAKMGFRSNTMCFLQNYKREYLVGRSFGTSTTPEGDTHTHLMFGAYGKLIDPTDDEGLQKMLRDPNPYIV
ncbi:MAG: MoaF N-terminal domain-containing protein [Oscillospiraceae bacterium]|jgi:hypothetical protein|nr:MoaF N-terminal domain-containing protein [Oscillospiraceae bacterium]